MWRWFLGVFQSVFSVEISLLSLTINFYVQKSIREEEFEKLEVLRSALLKEKAELNRYREETLRIKRVAEQKAYEAELRSKEAERLKIEIQGNLTAVKKQHSATLARLRAMIQSLRDQMASSFLPKKVSLDAVAFWLRKYLTSRVVRYLKDRGIHLTCAKTYSFYMPPAFALLLCETMG